MVQVVLAMSRRGVALAWCLAVFVFLGSSAARAQVTGSKHDFSGRSVAVGGSCGACHIPHGSQGEYVLWSRVLRGLGEEEGYFNQRSNPDYARGFTIACYDCHDNHAAIDDDPPDAAFDPTRRAQDVAFDNEMSPQPPQVNPNNPRDSLDNDGKPGYYENIPSGTAGAASTYISGHYVKNNPGGGSILQGDKLPCGDCHDPHRTRYQAFMREDLPNASQVPSGTKASMYMAYVDNIKDNRNDAESRRFCVACHGTSEQTTYKAVLFNEIKPSYGTAAIAKPTTRISAHLSTKTTACTKCHKHNAISTSCEDCHGFPPLQTIAEAGGSFDKLLRKNAENYSGGAGAHLRHRDALGENTIFQCEICHGPDPGSAPWHNTGLGLIPNGSQVNIIGLDTYWSPAGYPGPITPAYSGSGAGPNPGDSSYVFSSMGGGQQRCTGVACHGNPLASETAQLNWDDDMIDGDAPDRVKPEELQICKWCHDATPAMIDFNPDPVATSFVFAPSVMGNGLATSAGFGAEVNGHGVGLAGAVKAAYDKDAVNDALGAAGAAKECTVCHDATYFEQTPLVTRPRRTHFGAGTDPRDEKRLRDTINSGSANIGTSTTFPTGPDQACSACHQNGVNTVADGLDVSHHGIPPQPPPSGGYVPSESDPAFTRACRQCHDVHGANWNGTGRNLFMVGKWLDFNGDRIPNAGDGSYVDSTVVPAAPSLAAITTADNAVVFTATTNANSFDENDGVYDTTGVADRDDICATCHTPATGGGTGTGGGSHAGLPLPIGEMRGQNCLSCHDHDYENNSTTVDAFMPSGCFGCHGRSTADGPNPQAEPAYNGQYWPDGTPPVNPLQAYADDDPGAHYRHVQALALQLFGETPAEVIADSINGTTYTKQKAICAFCHNDPGGVDPEGGAHTRNDSAVRDPLNRVTVYLDGDDTAATPVDVFRKLTVGPRASGQDRTSPAPVNGDQAYSYANRNCTNLVCHNQLATPRSTDIAPMVPGNWDAPPNWAPGANADCSNTTCHATGTYSIAHAAHVLGETNSQLYLNYACTECHANNYAPVNLQHGNGEIDMVFTNSGGIEAGAVPGGGNAYYDKNKDGANTPATDTAFGYKTGVYDVSCRLVYCHGADNAWNGKNTTPVWNDPATTNCTTAGIAGTCHGGYGSPYDQGGVARSYITTGAHSRHFQKLNTANVVQADYGPQLNRHAGTGTSYGCGACHNSSLACNDCHGGRRPTGGHANGTINFRSAGVWPPDVFDPGTTLALTTVCNDCHTTATVNGVVGATQAKTNWPAGTPVACLSCHHAAGGATNAGPPLGRLAPDMLGDDVNYGAEVRGHNRAAVSGAYPVSANPAAALSCGGTGPNYTDGCHNTAGYLQPGAAIHINGVDDTTYAGNRMLGTINSQAVTTVAGACAACHTTAATSPATKKRVNMHANTDYAGRLEGLAGDSNYVGTFPAPSGTRAMDCSACHEPHGKVANGAGYNISMINPTISVPGTAAGVTAPGVRFEARTGNYSFNDTQGTDNDDLCEVCHSANGNALEYNTVQSGYHSAPGYNNDELGSDCSGCHLHNRDDNIATADGLMTVACNTCHSFPGLPSAAAVPPATLPPHLLAASHAKHVGPPSDGAAVPGGNKIFICNACHYQSSHNNAGMKPVDAWPAGDLGPNVQVRFANPAVVSDPLAGPWNTVAAAGNPADRRQDSSSFVEAANTCANLYCHGADAPFPAADAPTPYVAPDWDLPATGNCTAATCHRFTAAVPPGSLAHPKHAGNSALPADPQYSIGCPVCHYTTTTNGTAIASMAAHVNHSADVAFSAAADVRVHATSAYLGDAAVGSGYGACNATYCHSNGTDLAAPYDTGGTAAPEQALAWDDATGSTCWSCHGDAAASIGRPTYTDGTPKANKHAIHNGTDADPLTSRNTNGYSCQVCHYPTTHDNGSTLFATATHVNLQYNVIPEDASPALHYFGTYTWSFPGGTCAAVNCHAGGAAETVGWGLAGPIACDSCHARTAGSPAAADVNNFAWDGATQSKINSAEYTAANTGGHGKTAGPNVNQACADCHNNDVGTGIGHDRTMAGANPYRLRSFTGDQIAFCNTRCHTTPVRTHDPAEMQAAGITPKRVVGGVWPAPWNSTTTSPRCVNCHDPHGDGNLAMIIRALYDKGPFQINAAAPAPPTEQTNLIFTNNSTAPFVDAAAPYETYADSVVFSSICQECHEATGGATGMVSFHDGPSGGTTFGANHPSVGTTNCTECHRHDAGFAPSQCEGCHNINSAYPLAPNVMGPGTSATGVGTTRKPYDDGAWGFNVNGHGANGTAPSTPDKNALPPVNMLRPNAACTDCHDISDPPSGAGRHLNGTLNSVEQRLNLSTNTAHLKIDAPSFIGTSNSDVQTTLDNACYVRCHSSRSVPDMRHAFVAPPASQFGNNNTRVNGESIGWPVDSDISTNAGIAEPDFVPCVTCHNPHGVNPAIAFEPGAPFNHMLRGPWAVTMCVACHL